MNRTQLALVVAGVMSLLSLPASGQVPPFFNGGGGIFDPEISVVQSGVILDAQAVVSADRKYVTMTTRFQSAQLLNLREFAFQTGGGGAPAGQAGGGGVAGAAGAANIAAEGAEPVDVAAGNSAGASTSRQHATPRKPYPAPGKAQPSEAIRVSILEKEGMTLVGRVGDRFER